MKNKYKFEEEINDIIEKIEPRIDKMYERFREGLYYEAIMFSFWVGLADDLESVLTKIENKKKKHGNNKRRK